MLGILVMLNNYFHDFATAVIIVTTYLMLLVLMYAEKEGSVVFKEKVIILYPKLLHITGGVLALLLMAGIVRSFTYSRFEWVGVLGKSQVIVLIFKHIIMFTVVGYGIYLWAEMYKKVKRMREES